VTDGTLLARPETCSCPVVGCCFLAWPRISACWICHPLERHPDVLAEKQRLEKVEKLRVLKMADCQRMPDGPGKDLRRHSPMMKRRLLTSMRTFLRSRVKGFQSEGFSEDKACVKAAIQLMVRVRTGNSR